MKPALTDDGSTTPSATVWSQASGRHAGWLTVAAALAFYVFANAQVTALLSNTVMSGETAVLSNVIIEHARNGSWHYPLHAQHLFYPGFEKFVIHPPLHYFLASQWLSLFGIGIWQIHAHSTFIGVLGVLLAVIATARYLGLQAALLVPVLAAALYGFYYSSQQLRPDMSFGFVYGLCVLLFGRIVLGPTRPLVALSLWCGLFGIGVVAALATHWFGFFVQLYLPVLAGILSYRIGRSAVWPIAACAAGWLVGMAVWWLAFGDELLRALIIVPIKGGEIRELLTTTLSDFLIFITGWPGGWWLGVGLGLALLQAIGCMALAWRPPQRPLAPAERYILFLCANLTAYFVFFRLFVGNKNPVYGGNVYVLLLPLAAWGYARSLEQLASLARLHKWAGSTAAVVLAFTITVSAAEVRTYFVPTPWTLRNPNIVFNSFRSALSSLVSDNRSVVIGGNAYPYLYDKPYRSTMFLVASYFFREPENETLQGLLRHYRDLPGKDYRMRAFPVAARQELLAEAEMMVTTDHGHSWQWLFYDPQVWRRDFVEIATVFNTNVDINREPLFLSPIFPIAEQFFTVYVRKDVLASLEPRLKDLVEGPARMFSEDTHAIIVTFGPGDRHALVDGDTWKAMDAAARIEAIKSYFQRLNWYGAALDEARKGEIARQLEPLVTVHLRTWHNFRYNDVPFHRTLANGIDHAMSKLDIAKMFPGVPGVPRE